MGISDLSSNKCVVFDRYLFVIEFIKKDRATDSVSFQNLNPALVDADLYS